MSNIADLLKQYSRESVEAGEEGELPDNQVGAEEILVVTDENTTELEEAIEEIADAVNGKEESEAALDNVIEATESLESAIQTIRAARLRGQRVNGVAMQIWANGVVDSMEARHIPSELFAGLQEEFGDSFESDSYADYSVEAEEKAEGIMTKLWNMLKAAFAAVRDWFTKFLAWFGKSTEAVEKAGIKLQAAAKAKANATATAKTIPGGSYGELVVSGKVDAVNAVKSMEKLIKKSVSSSIAVFNLTVDAAKYLEVGSTSVGLIKDVKKLIEEDTGVGGKHVFANGTVRTVTFDASAESGKIKYSVKMDTSATKGFKGTANIPSVSEIETLGKQIQQFAVDARNSMLTVERATGRGTNVGMNKGMEKDELAAARKTVRAISGVMKISQNMTSDAVSAVMPVAKKAYSFGMVCLNHYK